MPTVTTPEAPGAVNAPALTVITTKDLQGASLVLEQNKGFVAKYQAKYNLLIAKCEKEGVKLTPETDKAINDFLVSLKTCVDAMDKSRKPFTQKANEFIKLFTNQENILTQSLAPVLQKKRDASVTQYKKDQDELDRKAKIKLEQDKQKITLLADAEQQIRNAYLDILNNDKNELLNAFETADANTIDAVEDLLKNIHPEFEQSTFDSILPVVTSDILTVDELTEILEKSKEGKFPKVRDHYKTDLEAFVAHLIDLLPDRREEISKGSQSSVVADIKEAQADANLQQEAIEQQVNEKVSNDIASVVMDHKIDLVQNSAFIPKAAAIESYSIKVIKREGWAEIFKFYFTHSPEQDLGKINGNTMKIFAERMAKAQGLKISADSIEYETKYKATAKKGK